MQTTISPPSEIASGALRIRFIADAPADAGVFCRFVDPGATVAVGESVAIDSLSSTTADSVDRIEIISTEDTGESGQKFQSWLGTPGPATVVIKTDKATVRWRPGRAVVQASPADCKSALPPLIHFAFYEGELRKLEQAVVPFEATANADVAHAYEMTAAHRQHWDRLYRTMEQLYRLRLQFARLEPHLDGPAPALPRQARQLFARLARKAQVAARLEALGNRLETCEDLYEGAVDRITDFKAYRKGNWLEIAIVLLLALETVLLLVQAHNGR